MMDRWRILKCSLGYELENNQPVVRYALLKHIYCIELGTKYKQRMEKITKWDG